jgi:hypothetical protein
MSASAADTALLIAFCAVVIAARAPEGAGSPMLCRFDRSDCKVLMSCRPDEISGTRFCCRSLAIYAFDRYLAEKHNLTPSGDPVDDTRRGWDMHVDFGLRHPACYLHNRELRRAAHHDSR